MDPLQRTHCFWKKKISSTVVLLSVPEALIQSKECWSCHLGHQKGAIKTHLVSAETQLGERNQSHLFTICFTDSYYLKYVIDENILKFSFPAATLSFFVTTPQWNPLFLITPHYQYNKVTKRKQKENADCHIPFSVDQCKF